MWLDQPQMVAEPIITQVKYSEEPNISIGLTFKSSVHLIHGLLQLGLDIVEVVEFVLVVGQLVGGLGQGVSEMLLLLVQLGQDVILVQDLVVEAAEDSIELAPFLPGLFNPRGPVGVFLLDSK